LFVAKRLLAAAMLLLTTLVISCQRGNAPPPPAPAKGPAVYITQNVTAWAHRTQSQGGTPGLDFAHIAYGTWEDRVVFAVWIDFDRVRTGGDHFNEINEQPEKRYAGESVDLDGRKITFECKTADGAAGAITVNGKSFDLTEGWLILASPARGELKQLKPERLSANPESPQALPAAFEQLKAHPDVQAFFSAPAKGETSK
jgi:hypothetical protein